MRMAAPFACLLFCGTLSLATGQSALSWGSGDQEAGSADLELLSGVSLLQSRLRFYSQAIPLPITWFHVPKTGSSLIATLVQVPGVCHGAVDLSIDTSDEDWLLHFCEKYASSCPGLYRTRLESWEGACSHPGLGGPHTQLYAEQKEHLVAMFREPRERIMSAHAHMQRFFEKGYSIADEWRPWGGWPNASLPDLPTFARFARGCVVKMLTRSGFVCGGASGLPSAAEVALAKARLASDFAFVGLTSRWALSMCLFNAIAGTGCRRAQFENYRPNPHGQNYNFSELQGVEDPYDAEVYAEAERLFGESLRQHGVSRESCKACYLAAGIEG